MRRGTPALGLGPLMKSVQADLAARRPVHQRPRSPASPQTAKLLITGVGRRRAHLIRASPNIAPLALTRTVGGMPKGLSYECSDRVRPKRPVCALSAFKRTNSVCACVSLVCARLSLTHRQVGWINCAATFAPKPNEPVATMWVNEAGVVTCFDKNDGSTPTCTSQTCRAYCSDKKHEFDYMCDDNCWGAMLFCPGNRVITSICFSGAGLECQSPDYVAEQSGVSGPWMRSITCTPVDVSPYPNASPSPHPSPCQCELRARTSRTQGGGWATRVLPSASVALCSVRVAHEWRMASAPCVRNRRVGSPACLLRAF